MNILIIGDIVGKPGRRIIKDKLTEIKEEYDINFTIANGENAAGGNGITRETYLELIDSGIDFLTMGNHVWDKKDVYDFIDTADKMVRPANYPVATPGKGYRIVNSGKGAKIGILNLSGRIFMSQLECPFRCAEKIIKTVKEEADIIIVDFHAEATSEKVALGWYLDGKASAVVGTHTHVQTNDSRVLPGGTAYITDLGMTGPRDAVLGVKKEIVIKKFLTHLPAKFEIDTGECQLNGVVIQVDQATGKAINIKPIQHSIKY
ncbi:hypothetical protein GGQ84_001851 [Desulfitispora alkaliphila]|uniref:TIGR00282 family metallophosphoesterase n=1 Tax=Desulfitispora alkaliphila TaxID=622674 RepID=UPI003D1B5836